jgi:hypothetical protein
MLPVLQFLLILASNVMIIGIVIYYFSVIRAKEKKIEKEQNEMDANFHHAVDDALSKERKIIGDATNEAGQIITQSKYLTTQSQQELNNAIHYVVTNIQKNGDSITQAFTAEYTNSLRNLSTTSLSQLQNVMSGLQTDLKKQIEDFHTTLLPQVEKELDVYKKTRMQEVDQAVIAIIQKASQEIFNKTISMSDHRNAVIQSLEKAKKEGVFE